MLRQLIIMTADGGLVLFQKGWSQGVVEEDHLLLLSGVLTAFEEFARQLMHMFVSYMEFGSIAVSLVRDPATELICAAFYEVAAGVRFGRLIASHLLTAFIHEYVAVPELLGAHRKLKASPLISSSSSSPSPSAADPSSPVPPPSTSLHDISPSTSSHSPSSTHSPSLPSGGPAKLDAHRFAGFAAKLPEALRTAPLALLEQLVHHGGRFCARQALLLYPDGSSVHTLTQNEIGLIANIKALLTLSSALMGAQQTPFAQIEMASETCLVHRVADCALVLLCPSLPAQHDREALHAHVAQAIEVLSRILSLRTVLSS